MTRTASALLSIGMILAACTSPDEVGPATAATSTTTTSTTTTTAVTTTAVTTTTSVTTPPDAPGQDEKLLAELTGLAGEGPTRVGLVAHRASVLAGRRTIDVLHDAPGIALVRIFTPEHGLAGTADAGQPVDDGIEAETGVPIRSLYGARRAPDPGDLTDLDAVVYDLQDVGVRAFTYIATMGLVLIAAAEAGLSVVIVDRTNPQGRVVDGPVRMPGLESFVSPYAIPPVYGLTSAELARLLRAEGPIPATLDLRVIEPAAPLADPWIPPSPNLPTLQAAWLYPAVVLFEATTLSVGRGTDEPFTVIGGPDVDVEAVLGGLDDRHLPGLRIRPAVFTPRSIPGMSIAPRYEGLELTGVELGTSGPLTAPFVTALELLDAFLDAASDRRSVIDQPDGFDLLAGNTTVRQQLLDDVEPAAIAESWQRETEAWTARSLAYRSP